MKTIVIPSNIILKTITGQTIVNDQGEVQTATFKDFIMGRLIDDKMAKDMSTILRVVKMRDGLDKVMADSATEWVIDDEDWRLLEDVVRNPGPSSRYNPAIAHCLVPFFLAVTEAK
jgi:hypothetical protein